MTNTHEIAQSIISAPDADTPDALARRTPFDRLQEMTLKTVAESSARVYRVTFTQWQEWCDANGVMPIDLNPANVTAFLSERGGNTIHTRKNKMAALRKLAEICAILDGDIAKVNYELLKRTKPPKPETSEQDEHERGERALTPAECNALLSVNAAGTDAKSRRDMAAITVLLFTGLRRSELAALKWSDIDLERGLIAVRHGKRDKARTAAIIDNLAIDALKAWRSASRVKTERRQCVFCSVNKAGVAGDDKPVSDKTVERIVYAAADAADIGLVRCHDLRRTFATEWLSSGGGLADLSEQLGHENESTTLGYAQPGSAERRRGNVRFRYGAVSIAKPVF